ncbi:MAG: multifunctional CCA addition/repair protein [Xanthomonadales bacterium]|nr:multifunctional CCA addition/repair protein [Xanthomonadales bacterium]
MKTYLVGGAVRDELLGLSPGERDWVVVGGTPDALMKQGFRQVGASFPVFIHPKTGEEYALARTERKQGHGYHGFTVDFRPDVTLEEDLERRDLTINAMARADDGSLVDPFGGQRDLEQRWLRHVSEAFIEDPLRVLRVARFAARFAPLGFRVHPDTGALMQRIVDAGEIAHLVPERAWTEIARAMAEPAPQEFVRTLRDCGALAALLPEVDALYGVPQDARYHPEVDTGTHLELCLAQAAEQETPPEGVFAVLLHDLGKGITPRDQWPSHHDHERRGVPLVESVCERLKAPNAWRDLALLVCREHLNAHRVLEMRPAKVLNLVERLDGLRQPERVVVFAQACRADWLGRGGDSPREYPQAEALLLALQAAQSVRVADLEDPPEPGPELGEALRAARVSAVRAALEAAGE